MVAPAFWPDLLSWQLPSPTFTMFVSTQRVQILDFSRVLSASIDRSIYNEIKKGALIDLGYRDLSTQQNPARD